MAESLTYALDGNLSHHDNQTTNTWKPETDTNKDYGRKDTFQENLPVDKHSEQMKPDIVEDVPIVNEKESENSNVDHSHDVCVTSSLNSTGPVTSGPVTSEADKPNDTTTNVSPQSHPTSPTSPSVPPTSCSVSPAAIEHNLQSATELLLRYAEILYKCTLCKTLPSILTSKTNFVSHIQSVHLTSSPHVQKCPRCMLQFGTKEDLRAHIQVTHETEAGNTELLQKGQVLDVKGSTLDGQNTGTMDHSGCRVNEGKTNVANVPESRIKQQNGFSFSGKDSFQKQLPGSEASNTGQYGLVSSPLNAVLSPEQVHGKYASTISICDQRFYYCQVCTTKFETELEASIHFRGPKHLVMVDAFERGTNSYGTQRRGASYVFQSKEQSKPETPGQDLSKTASQDFCVVKTEDRKSPASLVSRRPKRKRSLPRPVRFGGSARDSQSSGSQSDSDTNTTQQSGTGSTRRSPIHNAAGYSLLHSDRKRSFQSCSQNSRQNLSPQISEDLHTPSATICYKPTGSDTDGERLARDSDRESTMLFMRKVLSSSPLTNIESTENEQKYYGYPLENDGPIDMSNPRKRRKTTNEDCADILSNCSSSVSRLSPVPQSLVLKETTFFNTDTWNSQDGNRKHLHQQFMSTLDFSNVLNKQTDGKSQGFVNKASPKIKTEYQGYSDSSNQHCSQCGAEFPNAESFCQHFKDAHMGVAPQANTGDQQFKVLWLKQFLPQQLCVQDGGCVSRDELLERLSPVVDAADSATWGPACNRAVRELFPDTQALRKGKFKKTYFFGVRYADDCRQEETMEDIVEEEEIMDSATLRNMGQDLEKLMAHIPSVIRWSGHMDSCLSRDNLLQVVSRRMADSDVLNWGMQCNRAVRQLFPNVFMKRKGKYKTCYYGVELISEGPKTSAMPTWPRNAGGPPVVNALDIIDTPGPVGMSRLPRNAAGVTSGYSNPHQGKNGTHTRVVSHGFRTTGTQRTNCSGLYSGSKARDQSTSSEGKQSPGRRQSDTPGESPTQTSSSPVEDPYRWNHPAAHIKQEDGGPRLVLTSRDLKPPSPPTLPHGLTSSHMDNFEKLILLHPGPFVTARIFSRRFQRIVPGLDKVMYAMAMLQGRGLGQVFTLKAGNSKVFFKSVPSKSLEMPLSVLGVRLIDYQVMFHERDPKLEDTLHDKLKTFYPQLDLLSTFYKY